MKDDRVLGAGPLLLILKLVSSDTNPCRKESMHSAGIRMYNSLPLCGQEGLQTDHAMTLRDSGDE